MNPNDMFVDLPADEREELARLAEVAGDLHLDESFLRRTEMRLKDAFVAKKEKSMKRLNLFWQILAGTAAIVALALGTIWLVRSVAPEPHNPSVLRESPTTTPPESTSTPESAPVPTNTPEIPAYDWHGTKITLAVEFPQTPAEAGIYTHSASAAATIESALKLAERFGIQGDVYLDTSSFTDATGYLVTDGKQRLSMRSDGEFSYYADYNQSFTEAPVSLDAASSAIDTFLKERGFDFAYRLQLANLMGTGWFYVMPLTLDKQPVFFDFGAMQRMSIHVSPDGQIISLDAYLLNVDPQPMGKFGLISAEDAWQKFLQDASPGVLQSSHSGTFERSLWHRTYPDDQPVTLYGNVQSFAPAETGKPPFITIDGFTATGNTAGMEKLAYNTFAQAQGQFFSENGIRKFKVVVWQTFDQSKLLGLEGSLRSQGGNVIFSSSGTDYILEAVPADVPVPLENVSISGVAKGTQLDWQDIFYFKNPNHQGGGGGCGGSFAKLNLNGTPVPWPTSTPVANPSEPPTTVKRIEGKRGNLSISLYEQTDGSKRTEYNFFSPDAQYILEGQGLEQLNNYHNRPVTIWGTVTAYNQYQIPIVTVERFEIPYPDLKFQILRGTQKLVTINGQQVTLFKSQDGKSFVQMLPTGNPDNSLIGVQGDLVEYEVLIVPDETFGVYPAMRVFGGGMITDQPMTVTADQPYVVPEPVPNSVLAPALTIDSIELAYYTPNPQYASSFPDAMSPYLQPVWRFHGHYSDGSEMEILIQALKPDFLLPEAAPALQCG